MLRQVLQKKLSNNEWIFILKHANGKKKNNDRQIYLREITQTPH